MSVRWFEFSDLFAHRTRACKHTHVRVCHQIGLQRVSKCLWVDSWNQRFHSCLKCMHFTADLHTTQIQHNMVIDPDQPFNNARAKLIAVVLHFCSTVVIVRCISNCKWWAKEEITQNWYNVQHGNHKINCKIPIISHQLIHSRLNSSPTVALHNLHIFFAIVGT